MKVSVNIEGLELNLDGEVNETVDFVQKLQAKDQEKAVKKEEHDRLIKKEERRKNKGRELNSDLYDLWDWMVDNPVVDGIPISAAARHFQVTESCAGQRMCKLAKLGYAMRPQRGRYVAIDHE